jgi:hypothetical protein
MVVDTFHGGAGVAEGIGVGSGFSKPGIVRGEGNPAALRELSRVVEVGMACLAGGFSFAMRRRLVKAEHRWAAGGGDRRNEKGCGHPVAGLSFEEEFALGVPGEALFAEEPDGRG